jgi:hypothetical protein
MTKGSNWSSVIKELENVINKKRKGHALTDNEDGLYESEPFIRDFDITIQYLKSLNYLRSDPTLADIEKAHIQFYKDQVDDTYGQKGKGRGRGKGKKQVGPIATTPM